MVRANNNNNTTILTAWLRFVHTLVWQSIFQPEFLPQVHFTRMKSSALDALAYSKNLDSKHYKENKLGTYVYDGDPSLFRTWKFRAEMQVSGLEDEPQEYAKGMRRLLTGLQNDALKVVERVGVKTFITPPEQPTTTASATTVDADGEEEEPKPLCGLPRLIKEIGDMVFPNTKDDAALVFREYNKRRGILSRQPTESMISYVDRRKTAWNMLTELDPTLQIGPYLRTDLLLDNARITEEQKTVVQASIQNSKDYDKTVQALKYLHNRIHEGESPVKKDGGKGSAQRSYKPYGKGGKSRGKGKGKYHKKYHKHVANIADEDDVWEDYDETEGD